MKIHSFTQIETEALELVLEGQLLIADQLVITLPFNGHRDAPLSDVFHQP
jgi:hypothetical protein